MLHEIVKRDAYGLTKIAQLNDINPALPAFTFAHKRLRLTEPFCQLTLRETRLYPGCFQVFEERAILF